MSNERTMLDDMLAEWSTKDNNANSIIGELEEEVYDHEKVHLEQKKLKDVRVLYTQNTLDRMKELNKQSKERFAIISTDSKKRKAEIKNQLSDIANELKNFD